MRDNRWFIVLDGKEGPECPPVSGLVLIPDGRQVAYHTSRGGPALLMADGREERYAWTGSLVFSPNGKRMAAVRGRRGKAVVVVDGVAGREYDSVRSESLVFSPDSGRAAYAATRGGEWFTVVDGEESDPYDGVGRLVLGADSRRVAYVVARDRKAFIVVDGKEEKELRGTLRTLLFSPDGRRVPYVGEIWKSPFLERALAALLAASPGGKVQQRVWVDGVELKGYHALAHDAIEHPLRFHSPTGLHLWTIRDDVLFRVEVEIVDESER